MKCERIEDFLSLYLEDELSSNEAGIVKEHLKKCRSCALLLSSLKETKISLAGFPEIDVPEHLLNRLYVIPGRKKRFKLSFDFLLRPSLQPLLAGGSVLLIITSFYFFHPDRNLINKSIDRQIHIGFSKIERIYARTESFANSLEKYKDDLLVSIKNINPLDGNENYDNKM